MRGLVVSGLTLEKQKILYLAVGLLISNGSSQGCSSLAACGDYVSDGKLVMGRNWGASQYGRSIMKSYLSFSRPFVNYIIDLGGVIRSVCGRC